LTHSAAQVLDGRGEPGVETIATQAILRGEIARDQ
jgi:hypothetical protein